MFIIVGALVLLAIFSALVMFLFPKSTAKEETLLDVFSKKDGNSYNDDQIEQFREVLYTLKKPEINDWLHSLELREVEIPEILKAEVRMILAE